MTRLVYLHGFASSPASRKAQTFRQRLADAGIHVDIPTLDGGDFFNLTISGQLRVVDETVRGEPVVLMGSSLGGYLAALYAARHPNVDRLVLMAPAFGFYRLWTNDLGHDAIESWRESGTRNILHYGLGDETPLSWNFLQDAAQYESEPDFTQPALILHGLNDDVVPIDASRHFVALRPHVELHEFNSGHELTDVIDDIWDLSRRFLQL